MITLLCATASASLLAMAVCLLSIARNHALLHTELVRMVLDASIARASNWAVTRNIVGRIDDTTYPTLYRRSTADARNQLDDRLSTWLCRHAKIDRSELDKRLSQEVETKLMAFKQRQGEF